MISEGTNIPRLRVCCHLTRVKTELHFRQVLGRILRSDNEKNSEAFLFIPAEPNLIEYATRVAKEIPDGMPIKFDSMSKLASDLEADECVSPKGDDFSKDGLKFNLGNDYVGQSIEIYELREKDDLPTLAKSYEASVNIFGKFRQELISLQLGAH
jgi:superfamily II DNA or RNA helicase